MTYTEGRSYQHQKLSFRRCCGEDPERKHIKGLCDCKGRNRQRALEQYICLASVFLLEVTNRPDYTMENRLELRERVKAVNPDCKFVLEVDETSEPQIAEQVCQAKKDGLIDQFIYGSISASYFVALMDTL